MKKFMLITGITGIVCIVLGVVMVTVSLVAGGNFSSVVRNGPVRRHNDWGVGARVGVGLGRDVRPPVGAFLKNLENRRNHRWRNVCIVPMRTR